MTSVPIGMVGEEFTVVSVPSIVNERGGYVYHGRVAELAEGAREGGLKF